MLFFFWKSSGNSITVTLLSSWIFSFKKHLHQAWDAVFHHQIKLPEESWKYNNLGISDHHLIYAVINLRRTYHKPALKVIRDFKNVDVSALRHEFASTPWNICDIFDDIDDSVWAWETRCKYTINHHISLRKVNVRSNNLSWMNSSLRKGMNKRYKLLTQAQNTPKGSVQWSNYQKQRNAQNYYDLLNCLTGNINSPMWNPVKNFGK